MREDFQIDRYIRIGRAFDILLQRVEDDERKKKALYAFATFVYGHSLPVDDVIHCLNVATSFSDTYYVYFVVALYHDALEDHYVEEKYLMSHCDDIKHALDAITRRADETYKDYITRCKKNDIARTVKLVDLNDNILRCIGDKQHESLLKRYRKAATWLEL